MIRGGTVAAPAPRPMGAVAATVAVTAGGTLFNEVRLWLRFDEGSLALSVVAFLLLLAASLAAAALLHLCPAELGVTWPRVHAALAGGVLATLTLVGTAAATSTGHHLPGPGAAAAGVLLFGLCTAPAEEVLFRGVLWAVVERERGPVAAAVVTAAAFAIVHVPVYGVGSLPVATAAGLVLGWLRWWARSLLPCVAVHALADLALLWV